MDFLGTVVDLLEDLRKKVSGGILLKNIANSKTHNKQKNSLDDFRFVTKWRLSKDKVVFCEKNVHLRVTSKIELIINIWQIYPRRRKFQVDRSNRYGVTFLQIRSYKRNFLPDQFLIFEEYVQVCVYSLYMQKKKNKKLFLKFTRGWAFSVMQTARYARCN